MLKDLPHYWKQCGFKPNINQKKAILHINGPIFLAAGPGSGKTKVLLWRTLNLIVYQGVAPSEIFLSTFTEKAALQLRDGLRFLLGIVSEDSKQSYDISQMALGTVHSICQKIITDKRFSPNVYRKHPPGLLDALSQYFRIYKILWKKLCTAGGFKDEKSANEAINDYFNIRYGRSKHSAVQRVISIFNRFSEENLDPQKCLKKERTTKDRFLKKLIKMYDFYLNDLYDDPNIKYVDFSLLQKAAHEQLISFEGSSKIFRHVIVDEYQDTNAIQEKIFFTLTKGYKNICVVGDDDQALYRFRGATVENLVDFESRCQRAIGVKPKRIDLDLNYRSRKMIVDSYTKFIDLIDWKKKGPKGSYRVENKHIKPSSKDAKPSVVVSAHEKHDKVFLEIAELRVSLWNTCNYYRYWNYSF